jgi:hypothetical protein
MGENYQIYLPRVTVLFIIWLPTNVANVTFKE